MSISGVGAQASGYASQLLAALLAKTTSTQGTSDASSSSCGAAGGFAAASIDSTQSQNALTGSAKPSLSNGILDLLMQLQQDTGTASDASSTATAGDPLQQLFTAIDSNSDGSVSQSELENYVQAQGGTIQQADQAYAELDPSGTGAVSEDQMAQALKAGHHHHHRAQPPSADDVASKLVQSLNTDGNGSVSESELDSFVTANGGSSDQADSIFAALDTSGTGSISQSDFAAALEKLMQNRFGHLQGYSAYNADATQSASTGTIA